MKPEINVSTILKFLSQPPLLQDLLKLFSNLVKLLKLLLFLKRLLVSQQQETCL